MIRLAEPEIGDAEIAAVAAVLRSGYLVQGQAVRQFEQQVAEYVGVRHAIAVSSGTAALHLALLAAGVGPGDEVIVPDFTFPATANVVELCGATPILADIDLATFNIDPAGLRGLITPRTKAIMPVHLFGLSAEMDPLLELAREHGLALIEDAACALGAEYRGRRCGGMGAINCFSFHPRKIITTGEGGMLTTDDDDLAELARRLRNHGMVPQDGRYQFLLAGFNYRLTDFQGALGVAQMERLAGIIERRGALAALYGRALASLPLLTPPASPAHMRHTWQAYVVMLDERVSRDRVQQALKDHGVESTLGTYAISQQPHYQTRDWSTPNSVRAFRHSLGLPLHPRMADGDVDVVVAALAAALRAAGE